jgi:hypothetical protein
MLVDRTKYRYFPPELDPMIRVMREKELEAPAVKNEKLEREKAVKESNVENATSQKDAMKLAQQSVEAAAAETRCGELGTKHQESFAEGVKEFNEENATNQKDFQLLTQQSVEAEATETWGGEQGNEHQESFDEGNQFFNDGLECSGIFAGVEQTEENSVNDKWDSEATSSRDLRDSDSSWDGESTCDKRKHEPSSKEVEPPLKRKVCFDVEESPKRNVCFDVEEKNWNRSISDTMNHGATNATADTCNGIDHNGHPVIRKGSSDQLGGS